MVPSVLRGQETDPPLPTAELVESGTEAVLQAVSPVDDQVVWVSGHEGTLLRSVDGGSTWTAIDTPAGDTLQFRDVKGFSTDAAVVLSSGSGSLSRIYRTENAGTAWTSGFLMDAEDGFLDCLDFWDNDRGFAYGDAIDAVPYILVTENGGLSWERVPASALPPARAGEGGFAASGTCAIAGAGGQGWIATGAGGSARILATADYGRSWTAADLPLATGAMAGAFTMSHHRGSITMILGGDLGREEEVVANAVTRTQVGDWVPTPAQAPLQGAVYGSASPDAESAFAFGPRGSAYTRDRGVTWIALREIEAWAGAWAPEADHGWAVGTGGRIWVLGVGPSGR